MSPRPYSTHFWIGCLLMLAIGGVALAQAATDTFDNVAPTEQSSAPASFLTRPLDQLTPMQQEIRLRVEQEQLELARLSAAFAKAMTDEQAQVLQKQIHALKSATELAVLQIQLSYARAEGRLESVAELEQALATLERGSLQRQPANRPRPGDAHQ